MAWTSIPPPLEIHAAQEAREAELAPTLGAALRVAGLRTERFEFVRLSNQRRLAAAESRQNLTLQPRELRADLPSGWCKYILTA